MMTLFFEHFFKLSAAEEFYQFWIKLISKIYHAKKPSIHIVKYLKQRRKMRKENFTCRHTTCVNQPQEMGNKQTQTGKQLIILPSGNMHVG